MKETHKIRKPLGATKAGKVLAVTTPKGGAAKTTVPLHVVCNPKAELLYPGAKRTSAEHVVFVTFRSLPQGIAALAEEQTRIFAADGFCWGYGGEGPRGLATVLTDALLLGGLIPANTVQETQQKMLRLVSSQNMDEPWSRPLTEVPV